MPGQDCPGLLGLIVPLTKYSRVAEDDVRRMVEQAGFIDLSIEYASCAGESRMLRTVDRVTWALGQDLRIVHATKPTQPGQ